MSRKQTIIIPQEEFDQALVTSVIIVHCVAAVACFLFYILRTWGPFGLKGWYAHHPRAPYEKNKYFRFFWIIRLCFAMTVLMSVYSLFFIMPLNVAGSKSRTPAFNETHYYINGTNTEVPVEDIDFSCPCTIYDVVNVTIFPISGTAIQTMANINGSRSPDEYFLISHAIMVFYNTLCFMGLTFWLYNKYNWYRLRFKLRRKPENYTVRLTGYPKKDLHSEEEIKGFYYILKKELMINFIEMMEKVYGKGSVRAVHVVPIGKGVSKITDLKKKRYALVKKKEGGLFSLDRLEKKRLKKGTDENDEKYLKKKNGALQIVRIAQSKIMKCDRRIQELYDTDAWQYSLKDKQYHMRFSSDMRINYHYAKKKGEGLDGSNDEEILNNAITPTPEKPRKIDGFGPEFMSDTAYITFNNITTARIASSSYIGNHVSFHLMPAQSPEDICWTNHVFVKNNIRVYLMKITGFFVTVALCVLWVIPVAFAVSIANLATIEKYIPGLGVVTDFIGDNLVGNAIIVGFLPQLVIIIFFLLLFPLLKLIENIFDKSKTFSRQDGIVSNKYFAFRVVNIFFGGILANAFDQIYSQAITLAKNPVAIVPILGKAIPQQTNFYTQYILVNGIMPASLKLLDIFGALIYLIIKKFFTGPTPRAKMELETAGSASWAKRIPSHTFMFLIVVVFSTISPLMLAVGMCYYIVHYVAERYVLLFRKVQKRESGGLMWPVAFEQLSFGLLLYHVVMLGVFIDKIWVFGIVASVISFFATLAYVYYMEHLHLGFIGGIYPRLIDDNRELKLPETYIWSYCRPNMLPVDDFEMIPREFEPHEEELKQLSKNGRYKPEKHDEIFERAWSDGDDEEEIAVADNNRKQFKIGVKIKANMFEGFI